MSLTLEAVFKSCDLDKSGNLDAEELAAAFKKAGRAADAEAVAHALKVLDTDGDGVISLDEFKAIAWKLDMHSRARDAQGKLITKNNDSFMDRERRAKMTADSFTTVQGAWDLGQIEAVLSDAASESLRVAADERPGYIALRLLGMPIPAEDVEWLQEPPADLDGEIVALNELLRDAVNAAARRSSAEGTPLQRIAAFLVEYDQDTEWTAPLPEQTSLLEEAKAAALEKQKQSLAKAGGSQAKVAPNLVQLAVAEALATRGKAPARIQAIASKAEASAKESGTSPKKKGVSFNQDQPAPRRRRVPVLGRAASQVLPAVIGTFQDYSANRAKRMVLTDVMDKAATAVPDKLKWSDYEHELTTEDRALRAMGLMQSTKLLAEHLKK